MPDRSKHGVPVAKSSPRSLIATVLVLGLTARWAGAQELLAQDLKRLSLEELLGVEVSTAMRVPESTMATPAAVFVLTQDDIRRSGATSLPELLRLAPGLQVAEQDAARYAIGIRGFADRLARSMLVLMDGRAVYSPLFAGTYWESQDTLLEDIERIEIVRGPGGTLWGANAVNGIINVITKRAQDTQGPLVTATLGSQTGGPVAARYGRSAGTHGSVRAYAKGFSREAQFHTPASDDDAWHMTQVGARGDWTLGPSRMLTVQGDAYAGALGQRYTVPLTSPPFAASFTRDAAIAGGNVLARWTAPLGGGEYQVQAFYDRTHRDERPVAETRDTFDLDFQHRRQVGRRHGLVWGAGYRVSDGRITAVAPTAFVPASRSDSLFTAFVQDDITLRRDRLRLIAGAKLLHNDYSGVELQPSGRLLFTIAPSQALFAAVTRAVRTPSRVETDYTTTSLANPAVPAFVRLQPDPQFEAEVLTAYEAGYRVRTVPTLYVTASAFFNDLDHTLSTELLSPVVETAPAPSRLILPVTFANGLHGNSHGLELTGDLRPVPWWRATLNYSVVRIQMTRNPGSTDVSQERHYEGASPRHQLQFTSALDLPHRLSLDWFLRHVSAFPAGPVPAYTTSNVRVSWRAHPRLEVAIVGQNLHGDHHLEWPSGAGGNVEIRRSAQVSVTWRR